MSDEKRIIAEYDNAVEAEIAKGQLESAGIPSFVLKDDAGGIYPQLQYTNGVYLVIRESDYDEAHTILSETEPEQ